MRYRFLFVFVFWVCLMTGFTATGILADQQRVYAVWAELGEERVATLHYASMTSDTWTKTKQLVMTQGLHVTPVIAVDKKQNIWIVWIEQTKDENILRYAIIRGGKTESGRVRSAGNEQSYAPAIMIDNNDTPWIAWSGVVGKFADIYASRWNGSNWEQPMIVNAKNDSPDITPILGLQDNEIPWVSWFGLTEAHRYVQLVAKWKKGEWHVDKKTLSSKNIGNFIQQRMGTEIQLPDQAKQRLMGAVFVDSGKEIQSISERFISFQPPRRQK